MMTTNESVQASYNQINFPVSSLFNVSTGFSQINHYFEGRPLEDLLEWSLATFGNRVAQVTSFGPAGMVILDHLARINSDTRVITLDTQFLFKETCTLIEEVENRYSISIDIRQPSLSPKEQGQRFGSKLWETNPDHCCYLRKVLPLEDVLQSVDAWFTGLRRDQAATRAQLPLFSWDSKYNVVKINPLAGWTRSQVWSYILKHQVPYNPLHDQGYASIGCTNCTRPTTNQVDERSGRWHSRQKTECGIHITTDVQFVVG